MKRTKSVLVFGLIIVTAALSQNFPQKLKGVTDPVPDSTMLKQTPEKSPQGERNKSEPDTQVSASLFKKASADSEHALLERLKQIYGPEVKVRTTQKAETGYSGSGVVVGRSSEIIIIDTTPCSDKKQIMKFHKEYVESEISEIDCQGKKYSRSKVRQK